MRSNDFNWEGYIAERAEFLTGAPWDIVVSNIIQDEIVIHPTAIVEEGVIMKGPIFIGPNCFVGAHAYLRGGVYLMGNNSIGPGCEIKSSIIFSKSNLAHFNFVGNSIVGSNVNLEAGAIICNHYNERTDKEISVLLNGQLVKTGVTKFGAVVGDNCKIGANAVLSPGTLLPPGTIVSRLGLIQQSF